MKIMKTFNFVATIMMLSDVLPILTSLSKALRAKKSDFSLVASQLRYVQQSILQIKEHPHDQQFLSSLHETVMSLEIHEQDLEAAREKFNTSILQPHLNEVSSQISCRFQDSLGILTAFGIFDPQKCPTDIHKLQEYGNNEMERLLEFYGMTTSIEYGREIFSTAPEYRRQNWNGKHLNPSFLRRWRDCHCRSLPHTFSKVRQSVRPSPTSRLFSLSQWYSPCPVY